MESSRKEIEVGGEERVKKGLKEEVRRESERLRLQRGESKR